MKHTLHLKPVNGGPFNCLPAREVELSPEEILCNDIRLPGESHSGGMKLFVIGNEFGSLGAVWAEHAQDAFDELCDAGLSDGLACEEPEPEDEESEEEITRLGNHGEPHDLTNAWIQEVDFDPARDIAVLLKLAEARGMGATTLDF